MQPIRVEIAPGELIDKITILEIKRERIQDAAKLRNVGVELEVLTKARDTAIPSSEPLNELTTELKTVNEALWQIEDDIRDCERRGDFGPRFIELARSVYRQNDRRAAIKRQINELLGSVIVEEKSYRAY
jgi:hypothetical protein